MRYLCLIYDDEKKWEGLSQKEQEAGMAEYGAFTESVKKNGHWIAAERLQPVQTATTVRIRNGKLSTTDGPYAETKEQLGGFYLINAKDLNDAIQIASRIPCAKWGSGRSPSPGGHRVSGGADERARAMVDAVYRSDSRRVLATLIRLLGDFDLAEEALQDAFAAAVEQWPTGGVPANPRAWLVSAGRFKAIDAVRRRARFDASLSKVAEELDHATPE